MELPKNIAAVAAFSVGALAFSGAFLRRPIEPEFIARAIPWESFSYRLKTHLGARLRLPFDQAEHLRVSEGSLLVRSIETVNNSKEYGFGVVVNRLCEKLQPGQNCDTLQNNWAADSASELSGYFAKPLDRSRFRLLAIVNRLDLSTFAEQGDIDSHRVRGMEVRFEYGWTDTNGAPLKASVIVEITLKPMKKTEFQGYLGAWTNYKSEGKSLQCLLEEQVWGRVDSAKLRQFGLQGASWPLQQYQFSPKSLSRSILDRELVGDEDACSGRTLKPCISEWLKASGNACKVLEGDYNFGLNQVQQCCANGAEPCSLFPPVSAKVTAPSFNPLILGQAQVPLPCDSTANPKDVETVEKLINLGTCRGCHSRPTDAKFTHIYPREHSRRSCLSGFLTGYEQTPDSCDDGDMTVPTIAVNAKGHNDLLRRHLYLRKVLTLAVGDNWTKALGKLRAFQIH